MPKPKVLPPDHFARPTVELARSLLGQHLCHADLAGRVERWPIAEVEAYDGNGDLACHAAKKKTPRNAIMFGPPGYWYVYLCYGVHWLLNIVAGPEDFPAAVLIRGAGGRFGPGRLTRSLGIDGAFNRQLASPENGLWLEESGLSVPEAEVEATPRIGINYAGEEWVKKPWRFVWNREPSQWTVREGTPAIWRPAR